MSHWVHLNFWPDELIQLQREIQHHPRLVDRLQKHPAGEWEVRLAEIAQYCEVILDGNYMPEEIQKLAGILYQKLLLRREDNRGILIIETPKL